LAGDGPGEARLTDDPLEAVVDADIIYTDQWMTLDSSESSDGHFTEPVMNLQVTEAMVSRAASDALFLHCLPCTGETCEVAAAHIEGNESIVFDQTHNRLHVQKALLLHMSKSGTFPPHEPDKQKDIRSIAG
jgi:ornithine carbamoyltransferase